MTDWHHRLARLRLRFPGGEVSAETDEEGFWEACIEPQPAWSATRLWHPVGLELLHPADGPRPARGVAQVLIPPPGSRFGVISDLDDTVIRSDATAPLRMARTVFFGNARTRAPFPGVAAFYRALQAGSGSTGFNPIFYVSSSPWNLYDLLSEFLLLRGIPPGPLFLRDWGITPDEVFPSGQGEHKRAAIQRVLEMYPALPFMLMGDSGQEDPEIYARVVHEHPDRILAVYIRNVVPEPLREREIRALAEQVSAAGSTLLLAEDTVAAARHAAERGWIAPEGLAEVATTLDKGSA